ncbi:response regulator transcription factor [Litorilinea aerophila]|uniref:Response regulator transcription factor n=1 Tax=Litorilinea aerophila TaxID=1204385 RepID=A0A540V8H6_9CHLR|nr:response regulator transcription factor [Litorilinea aerophila]MCC9079037.1 response regulator transcription factor [Litorilinea aerophila]GIV75943.1 MAG: DNA-binding response regulator [Litorilinea sp.]GIV75945.1 MAG: DNA-binding response regulator [Litorilinea sp.]
MSQHPIRVLIVDDHTIVRKGTRALFVHIPDIEVVGEAANGLEAIDQVEALNPDVVLLDLVMPGMDGIEAIRHILAIRPNVRILALTSFASDDKVFPAIKAGALGYLLKDANTDELIEAVRQVFRGEPSLHPVIARKMLKELSKPPGEKEVPLTDREVDVLKLVAKGMSNEAIAQELAIAEVTVRTHVSNILSKLRVSNRVQATLYALHEGLVSLDEIQFPGKTSR